MIKPAAELERTWELCRRIAWSPEAAALKAGLLEPTACLLGAETAVVRIFSVAGAAPRLPRIAGLEIRDSVHDAYLSRYCRLDPARHLLGRRFPEPVFADQHSRGEWRYEQAKPPREPCGPDAAGAAPSEYRRQFRRYWKEFLLPNHFYHHLGFCFQNVSAGQMCFLDFHRAQRSAPFSELDLARAKIIAVLLHARAAGFAAGEKVTLEPHSSARGGPLSAREYEVAQAVASGLTNKEVGAALGISVRTVENHLRSIFAKLEVSTRTRLAAKLHEGGQGPAS